MSTTGDGDSITYRPDTPLVRALAADNLPSAVLQHMRDRLAPGQWAVDSEDGFWWIPHRLQHSVEVLRRDDVWDEGRWVCRSAVTLVEKVQDQANGIAMAQYLNQRPFGASVWMDLETDSIKATSWVTLEPQYWFLALCFQEAVAQKIGICEHFAPRLAELVSGEAPCVSHPIHGLRQEPDEFVVEAGFATYASPEVTLGTWWSRKEIQVFRNVLSGEFGLHVDPAVDYYDADATATRNLWTDIEFWWPHSEDNDPEHRTVGHVGQTDHPDLGRGIEILVSTPFDFGSDTDMSGPPTSSPAVQLLANSFNHVDHASCSPAIGISGWTAWRDQICLSTFVQGETVTTIQHLASVAGPPESASSSIGVALGVLTAKSLERLETPALSLKLRNFHNLEWSLTEDSRWAGVNENAGYWSLFVEDRAAFDTVAAGLPLNVLAEPIRIDPSDPSEPARDLWGLQHTHLLASFGIFNPAGPSVGSLELSINYESGQALLLERLRHPFSPHLIVHALIDQDGFLSLNDLVEGVIARLQWSTLDWFEICATPTEGIAEAAFQGLLAFGQRINTTDNRDLRRLALALFLPPWTRLSLPAEELIDRCAELDTFGEIDELGFWAISLMSPRNIDKHAQYLRSAWEGARAWLASPDDPDHAQRLVNVIVGSVDNRSDADLPFTPNGSSSN